MCEEFADPLLAWYEGGVGVDVEGFGGGGGGEVGGGWGVVEWAWVVGVV